MENKRKALLLIVLSIVMAAGSIISILATTPAKHRKVIIKRAHEMNFADTAYYKGRIEPLRKQTIHLDPEIKVREVFAVEGQTLKAGDAVLELDDEALSYKLRLEEIDMELAEKELAGLTEGVNSEKKDLEFEIRKLRKELEVEVHALEELHQKHQRDKRMLESGIIAQESLDASANAVKKQESKISLLELELERLNDAYARQDKERQDKIYRLNRELEKIGENIKNLKKLKDIDTRAGIDGRLVKMDISNGEYPTDENSTILIYDFSKYTLVMDVKQRDAVHLRKGMTAEITLTGMEDKKYKGTVEEIDEIADNANADGTAKIRTVVVIDNPDESIKVGYEAEVKLALNMKSEAVVVEYESIIQDKDDSKYIYYVHDNFAVKRPVRTGMDNGFYVEILEGIIAGDQYVLNPPEDMLEKSSVRIWGWRYEFK